MKRIRNLGLAAILALALSALVGVGTASASWFVSETTNETTVRASSGSQYFTLGGGLQQLECKPYVATGELRPGASSKALEVYSPEESCLYSSKGYAPLKSNGCKFIYHPGAETGGGTFAGTLDIGPPNCGPVTLEGASCLITIYPKTGINARYQNLGTGTGRYVEITLEGPAALKYNRNGGYCGKGSGEDGGWTGSWTLKAEGPGGAPMGIKVGSRLGMFMTGSESAEESKQPKFALESTSDVASVKGVVSSPSKFAYEPEGLPAECTAGTLGTGWPGAKGGSIAELSFGVTYETCLSKAEPYSPEVRMNGCSYVFHVANVGPPYSGSADLACGKESKGVEVAFVNAGSTLCTYTFPAQKLGSATYETVGAGSSRTVSASVKGSGLTGSRTGATLCGPKSSTKGTFEGGFTLEAVS